MAGKRNRHNCCDANERQFPFTCFHFEPPQCFVLSVVRRQNREILPERAVHLLTICLVLSLAGKSRRELLPHYLHIPGDRKSTRLNSSHLGISYAVFCL